MIKTLYPIICKTINDSSLSNYLYNNINIYNNNIYTSTSSSIDKDSSILDFKGTTSPETMLCSEQSQRYVICSECDSTYQITITCDKRTCPACQRKRALKLFRKYLPIMENWVADESITTQFLTLTIKNKAAIDRKWIDAQDKHLNKLIRRIKRKYEIMYGFINKECVYHAIGDPRYSKGFKIGYYDESNYGYHYHFHILFFGERIDLKRD